ncbi:hypothetical protein Tco_0984348 [Tanacetum coccineum]
MFNIGKNGFRELSSSDQELVEEKIVDWMSTEIVESKEIEVAKIGTENNEADAFTKVVPGPKFKYCMEILSVGAN